MGGRRVLAL